MRDSDYCFDEGIHPRPETPGYHINPLVPFTGQTDIGIKLLYPLETYRILAGLRRWPR
ncbi:MAG: hypothetical protein LV471_07220 [Nitrosomonas sp.]|nr:hypothetical protein [Nitrosomonas sp.]